jgi:hypothetical protein
MAEKMSGKSNDGKHKNGERNTPNNGGGGLGGRGGHGKGNGGSVGRENSKINHLKQLSATIVVSLFN